MSSTKALDIGSCQDAFQYSPLQLESDEIRLVQIQPARADQPPLCMLKHFAWNERPQYVALSYTWGDVSPGESTFINGKISTVRKNLSSFFWHAFQDSVSPYLWIDAICINQKDISERNAQVLRMKAIYEGAAGVLIWLGPSVDGSDVAIKTIEHLGKISEASDTLGQTDAFDPYHHPVGEEVWRSLSVLLGHPYWSRAWVMQEASTPCRYGKTKVVCGGTSTTLEYFISANHMLEGAALRSRSRLGRSRIPFNAELSNIKDLCARRQLANINLMDMLSTFAFIQATDPRDKIYALLSITKDGSHSDIQPDYSLSVPEVYVNLAAHLIKRDNLLNIMPGSNTKGDFPDLPSWVPDWTARSTPVVFDDPHEYYKADSNMRASLAIKHGGKVLQSRGFRFDCIEYVTRAKGADTYYLGNDKGIMSEWCDFALSGNLNYVTGEPMLEVLQRTLCADISFRDGGSPRRGGVVIEPEITKQQSSTYHHLNFGEFADAFTWGRRLVRTLRGHVGLAPDTAQPGDIVCILLGHGMPCVLRREAEHYVLIGPCYVHGIMDGEVIEDIDPEQKSEVFEIW